MNPCQHCKRPTQLYLCQDCTHQLTNMLAEVPWLLEELDAQIQNLARLNTGTIGRARRADELNVMDFAAAERARNVHTLLLGWVDKIATRHLGRPPANLQYVTTGDLARWLHANTHHIANDSRAGKLYADIKKLVGDDQRGGELVQAINPTERHPAGPCPTIVGRQHNGTPRQCGRMLFADTYDRTVDCPDCGQTIDVERNRRDAAAARDLHTKAALLEVLDNVGEPITEDTLDRWIAARRLRPGGYLYEGTIVEFQIPGVAPEPVYSIERAQKLQRRDTNLRVRTHGRSRT